MWLEILGIASVGALWILSEPTIRFRNWLFKDSNDWFVRLCNCALCSTFWIGLGLSFDIYIAAIASVIAEFIVKNLMSGL